ncbi:MAG: hypothetical protein Unbinned5858contig1004_17 [Prokaryotic dsDNA virus sp.]|nr:MAG: hypothetical protein Unbinned5858contig1004_17 [Prokaryotic dsDNA virus sp.]|tara:strand:- start:15854 stop:17188 length:1335 start_codon:yes stop_codon:yes gene_type:complete
MAFSFGTTFAPPESPVEKRQTSFLSWSDSAVTIDTWVVEIYLLKMDGTTIGTPIVEAFVAPIISSNNAAQIDLKNFVLPTSNEGGWYASLLGGSRASITTPGVEDTGLATGYQLQVFSSTNGVKSSLQGSYNYIPLNFATKQPWDDGSFDNIFEHYPIDDTVKGWLTDRNVTAAPLLERDYIRYDMALQDEAVADVLQLEAYDYEFETGKNTNEANWDRVKVLVYKDGVLEGALDHEPTIVTSNFEVYSVPIGPANLAAIPSSDSRWDVYYDIASNPWTYLEYYLYKFSASQVQKGQAIRVYQDCRPIKHKPAQLMFQGSKGTEFLRFDGRVKDTFNTSNRQTFSLTNTFTNEFGEILENQQFLPNTVLGLSQGIRGFVLSEDFFTNEERELFKLALVSREVAIRYDGKWYPVRMKTSNYVHEQASARLSPINCEFEIAKPLLC